MKFREIERLRGLAILLVMVCHFTTTFPSPRQHLLWITCLRDGWMGVDLFFVISGFVVTSSLLRRLDLSGWREALRDFYLRRFFRIAPAALAWILIPLVAVKVLSHTPTILPQMLTEAKSILLFKYNYDWAFGGTAWFVHFWSLTVEEHYYFALPLFLACVSSPKIRVAILLALIALVAVYIRPMGPFWFPELGAGRSTMTHVRSDALLGGTLLALLIHFRGQWPTLSRTATRVMSGPTGRLRAISWVLFAVMAAAMSVMKPSGQRLPLFWISAVFLVALAQLDREIVFARLGQSGVAARFSNGMADALEYLASRSFSLYLVHRWFMMWIPLKAQSEWLFTLEMFVPIFIVSEISYRGIEAPFLRIGRRLTRR